MTSLLAPRPASNAKSSARPLDVSLLLTINGQSYEVTPLAHAPGGARSFRLAKVGGDDAVYDLDAFADRIECSCPSHRKWHAGTSSLCKHSRALIMAGLLDYPTVAAPASYAEHMAKLAVIAGASFMVKAGMLSGEFYLYAGACFASTVPIARFPDYGPLIFGVVSGIGFIVPGVRYHLQRRRARARHLRSAARSRGRERALRLVQCPRQCCRRL